MLTYKVEKFFKVERYSEMMKSVSKNVEYSQRKFRDFIRKKVVANKGERCLKCCVAKFGDFQKKCIWCAKCGAFLQYCIQIKRLFLGAKMCSHTKLRGSLKLMRIRKREKIVLK